MVLLRTRRGLGVHPQTVAYQRAKAGAARTEGWLEMISLRIVAAVLRTATPLAPDSGAPSAFEWWSEIVLPTLVGAGSIATAVVAILIARRSNKLARAATSAATRSNEIARRANRLEEQRDRRAADADARVEREAFRARWEPVLQRMASELQWGASEGTVTKTARDGAQLITEAEVREFYPLHVPAMQLLNRAKEADGGDILFMQASAAAHALLHDWVRAPDDFESAVVRWNVWMDQRVKEHAEDLRGGLPT